MKPLSPPPCGCPPPLPYPPRKDTCEKYLMQRILASGKLHQRCKAYSLCLDSMPCTGSPPFTLVDATVSGQPIWQELPCHQRATMQIQVTVPLLLRFRDSAGCISVLHSSLDEQLLLHCISPDAENWRGQIYVQAAVRSCSCVQLCTPGPLDARLEVILEGYVLTACPMGSSSHSPYPPSKPWYPQPRFDPWNE